MNLRTSTSVLAVACWALAGASSALADWRAMGLSGRNVWRTRAHAGFLYACTDRGLHRIVSDDPDTLWTLLGFAGETVLDLAFLGPQTFLAAKVLTQAPGDSVSLFRSTDGGGSWHPFQNGFGAGTPGHSPSRQARHLLAAGGPSTVFAASPRIEKSTDGALSWRVVAQAGALNALEGSPADPEILWAGGETAFLAPYALKSTDAGETWKQINLEAGGDNAVDAIAAHPSNPDVVYLGMEGLVMKSEDGGTTWIAVTSPDPSMYTYGMAIRPSLPLKVFAAGASYTPDPRGVVFHYSVDGGQSWEAVAHPADLRYGAWHLLLAAGAEESLYVATDNGIYRHIQGTVGAPLPGRGVEFRCRPNPFGRTATIEFELRRAERVTLEIADVQGRMIATLVDGVREPGVNRLTLDASGIRPGLYFARLKVGAGMATRRLLHVE